jgi:hypothetical protein
MPHHFRDRVILNPGNIPQLPSGRVLYVIGSYRAALPHQNLDTNAGAITDAIGTGNVFDAQYAANLSADMDASAGAITDAIGATSP